MSAPTLLLVVGPPAVGKMTVGTEIARRTGLRLFHNHQTIDLVLPYFAFGTPPFNRLVGSFRRQLLQEVANSDLPGVIFTFVWAFNDESDERFVEEIAAPFRERGGRVLFVELEATQAERVRRNATEFRLAHKPFKRDTERSAKQLFLTDSQYTLNSGGKFDHRDDYLRVENTTTSADDVAEMVIQRFGLARVDADHGRGHADAHVKP